MKNLADKAFDLARALEVIYRGSNLTQGNEAGIVLAYAAGLLLGRTTLGATKTLETFNAGFAAGLKERDSQ